MVSNEVDVGYKVTVSKMFEASGVADESGEFFVYPEPDSYVKANTQYLVTLDVNGVNKLYRELWTSGDFDDNTNVALSDYTYIMDEQTIADLSEDDAVVVRFEEVEVKTSDAFRAAVNKVAPVAAASEGGSGSSGVLVVNGTWNEAETECTLDKTWTEIRNADLAVVKSQGDDEVYINYVTYICEREPMGGGDTEYCIFAYDHTESMRRVYVASSADGYPTYSA